MSSSISSDVGLLNSSKKGNTLAECKKAGNRLTADAVLRWIPAFAGMTSVN